MTFASNKMFVTKHGPNNNRQKYYTQLISGRTGFYFNFNY